jgi:hypothetical protein
MRAFIASEIDHEVALRLGAADQHIAGSRRIDWIGLVGDGPGHKPGFTTGTDTGAARPPGGDVARFGKLKQALNAELQWTLEPLRANETSGPALGGPGGKCGARCGAAAMPGVFSPNCP